MKAVVAAVLLALLVSACASAPRPTAAPNTADRAGAPIITTPRDLSSRANDPCRTLLGAERLGELGFSLPGRFRIDPIGSPVCTWIDNSTDRRVSVAVVLTEDMLVNTYRKRIFPVFRPFVLDGAPGVDIQPREDSADCTTTLGVADRQSLEMTGFVGVDVNGVRDSDPCALNREVAREILSTLPPLR